MMIVILYLIATYLATITLLSLEVNSY